MSNDNNNKGRNPWSDAKGGDTNSAEYKKKKGIYAKKNSGKGRDSAASKFAAPQYKGVKQKPLKSGVPKPKIKGETSSPAPVLKKDQVPVPIVPLDNASAVDIKGKPNISQGLIPT
ncbi:MAG: hypothetical protein AAFP03_14700, partial [Cyanobacteria bacterium J06598_3]